MVDGHHTGRPHFPRWSERSRMHEEYESSNRYRDRTREAYQDESTPVDKDYKSLGAEQMAYYNHTSDGMLPRHHATLLPLARDREGPNYQCVQGCLNSQSYTDLI